MPTHCLLLKREHGFISAGLEPGDVRNAHFHLFRRASAAEEMGRLSLKISALKNGANENQKLLTGFDRACQTARA